jgi:hypothetical protein
MAYVIRDVEMPLNKWDKKSIRPGPVGSVGDVLTSVRIKQSTPDMPFAYNKTFNPKNDVLRGSNVQDGQWHSFSDNGYNARVVEKRLGRNRTFKTTTGWYHQDIIPTDKYVEPKVMPMGRTGWNTQVAEILSKQGTMFQETPGGYAPPSGVLPRGNQYPRQVSIPTSEPKIMNYDVPVSAVDKTKLPKYSDIVTRLVNPLPMDINYSETGALNNINYNPLYAANY